MLSGCLKPVALSNSRPDLLLNRWGFFSRQVGEALADDPLKGIGRALTVPYAWRGTLGSEIALCDACCK